MDLTETFNQMAEEIHVRETERFDHLARMRLLLDVSVEILSETTGEGLLQKIVDASRVVTHANLAVAGSRRETPSALGGVQGRRRAGVSALETFRVHEGESMSKY